MTQSTFGAEYVVIGIRIFSHHPYITVWLNDSFSLARISSLDGFLGGTPKSPLRNFQSHNYFPNVFRKSRSENMVLNPAPFEHKTLRRYHFSLLEATFEKVIRVQYSSILYFERPLSNYWQKRNPYPICIHLVLKKWNIHAVLPSSDTLSFPIYSSFVLIHIQSKCTAMN